MTRQTAEYERFKELTGLNVSATTFYRMKREMLSGEPGRLNNIIDRKYTPAHEKKGFKKHADPDTVPFLSFDGEGRTLEGKHKYVYLANSDGDSLYRPAGISTVDALDYLVSSAKTRRIRVFFSFGYDVQQILKDVPDDSLVRIMHGQPTKYKSYTIQYLSGKIFTVNNVRFYDVFNYWQTSFINAVRQTLGPNAISNDLVRGKESRSDFASWSIDDIARYTAEELDLLVKLCDHLRSVMLRADIHLGSAFYGPGSVANYWFKHYGIKPPKITDSVLVDVMERGYYGGRFESFRLGRIEPVYECDINSAYPSVIADLPYLDEWEKWSGSLFDRAETHSIWHVKWGLPVGAKIGPFPSRDRHGLISYPRSGIGWYWKPEVEAAIDLFGADCFEVIEGYNPSVVRDEPFAWVKDVYNWRLELKANNDPAQWALKVGLNSLYGKTAQRVGSARYFSLAWAGFITSATRAKLLRSVRGRTDSLIAFATDAAYFDKDPSIPNSKLLGEWSAKRWHRGYFIQSGVYRLETADCPGSSGEHQRDSDGNVICHKDAYRGFSVKNGIQDIFDQIIKQPMRHPLVYQTKFVGHLEAIRAPEKLGPYRLCFIVMKKKLRPYNTTKRKCMDLRVWHELPDFGDGEDDYLVIRRGDDFTRVMMQLPGERRRREGWVWNSYDILLRDEVPTEILENHNDHQSRFAMNDIGILEESYPFKALAARSDDIALSDSEGIAEERVGGAHGVISLEKVRNLPVVDEDDVIKEILGV